MLCPPRFSTRGYTGAQKDNQRVPKKITPALLQNYIEKLVEAKKFATINPESWVSFVRMEAFIMLDYLLTSYYDFERLSSKEIDNLVIEFCEKYCELYGNWIKEIRETNTIFVISL